MACAVHWSAIMSSPADAATLDRIFRECFGADAVHMTRAQRDWVPDAARDDFAEHCAEKRSAGCYRQLRDSGERTALAISLIQDTEQVKRARNSERDVTRSLLGYEESDEARAERAEAKVAALMEKVAELNATVGELKGENKVLREHSERLFAMLEARPKQ